MKRIGPSHLLSVAANEEWVPLSFKVFDESGVLRPTIPTRLSGYPVTCVGTANEVLAPGGRLAVLVLAMGNLRRQKGSKPRIYRHPRC